MPTSSGFQINEVLTAANTNTYLLRAGRNCIINGGMNIAQRGTSVAGITSIGYYTADRWQRNISAAGTWTDTVQSISASDAPIADGVRNSLKTTCTTATGGLGAGAYNVIAQNIEGFNVQQFSKGNASAKYFALSFWVKSNAVGTYIAELFDYDNNRCVSASYSIASSGVWQKVRLILPADSVGALDNDNNQSLTLNLWLGAGSAYNSSPLQTAWASPTTNRRATGQTNVGVAVNNYYEITAVQLEPNAVCTPFEVEDIQQTLSKCQRYYYGASFVDPNFFDGYQIGGAYLTWWHTMPQVMRVRPPTIGFGIGGFTNISNFVLSALNNNTLHIYAQITSTGRAYFYVSSVNASAEI